MRKRKQAEERTSFQEHGPYDPCIDGKADVAMVYGLDRNFEARMAGWGAAGYRLHVMTGVSWGSYADYVRGEWDGAPHFDDAQTAEGGFRLEHGMSQGHDIYYMMPSMPYVRYLAEKMRVVVDAGALALHLEEPEFWVRAGYEEGFQREWLEAYGETWQDPASSPDARYRCEKLKQALYTRALDFLFTDIKEYARQRGLADFRCYVPTHSLINYAHWRIVSPESQLITIPNCDGLIGQVWTGTSRTPTVYRGVLKQRTFEAGYCEYAACAALVRGTEKRLWQLADPIEDNPNYSWSDYRECWECDVTAALLSPENTRFEIMPWPSRIFKRSYPTHNLDQQPLDELLGAYLTRLRRDGKGDLAAATVRAIQAFRHFEAEHPEESRKETLGFASLPRTTDDLRFGDILMGAFAFYKHLAAWADKTEAATLRNAISMFYHDPTDEKEPIPAAYATELQVVHNALADMDWSGDYEWLYGTRGIGVAISDSLMYQRGEPEPSDADMSSFYGIALPLLKHGVALTLAQLERCVDEGYLNDVNVLFLTYEGMKPTCPEMHIALAQWVHSGNCLVFLGKGDAYNSVREWWNQDGSDYNLPQAHLTELLGVGRDPHAGSYEVGKGLLIVDDVSPAQLAHRTDGDSVVIAHLNQVMGKLDRRWRAGNTLALRRGPYIAAGGMDETDGEALALQGLFVNLYEHRLPVIANPILTADMRWLLVSLSHCPNEPGVIAAAGRVTDETVGERALAFTVEGMANTQCAVRAKVPNAPIGVYVAGAKQSGGWDAPSGTILLQFPNQPQGVTVMIEW